VARRHPRSARPGIRYAERLPHAAPGYMILQGNERCQDARVASSPPPSTRRHLSRMSSSDRAAQLVRGGRRRRRPTDDVRGRPRAAPTCCAFLQHGYGAAPHRLQVALREADCVVQLTGTANEPADIPASSASSSAGSRLPGPASSAGPATARRCSADSA
jgi:hypothetical protein